MFDQIWVQFFSVHMLNSSPLPKIKRWGCEEYQTPPSWFVVYVKLWVLSADHNCHYHPITGNSRIHHLGAPTSKMDSKPLHRWAKA
jgi:hypothetical protein